MRSLYMYRVSQEERSIFWEVIISVILSRKVYMYMCISTVQVTGENYTDKRFSASNAIVLTPQNTATATYE